MFFPWFCWFFQCFSEVFSQIWCWTTPKSWTRPQGAGTACSQAGQKWHPMGIPHGPAVQTAPGEVLPMATPSSQGLRQGRSIWWHGIYIDFFLFFPNQKVPKHPDLGVAYWTIPLLGYGSWMELVSVTLFLCPGGWFPRHDQVPARILWVRVWKMANRGKDWIGILGSPWALVPLQ